MLTAGLNRLWMWQCRREAQAFHRAASQVRSQQEELLLVTLRENAYCQYGRKFNFASIGSLTDFQDRVPICDYESLRPEFDAIAAAQPGVLTTEPVLMLEPTGGSSGGSRLIPYTATLRRQFQRAISAWMHDVLAGFPGVRGGRAYWSISPAAQRPTQTPGGIRIGFDSDTEYLTGWQRWAMTRLLAVPSMVSQLSSIEDFQYATLAYLLAAEDLALISVWSPTFLTTLFNRLPSWTEPILADMESGCGALNRINNPRRARHLQRLFHTHGASPKFLAACWPRLSLLSAWGDAAASLFISAMRSWLPDVPFQPKGLLATEGVISFPLKDYAGSPLAIRSHVFEFVPIAARPDQSQRPLWAWELEVGACYRVLLTTGGGLYRYDLDDEVEVVGYFKQCPQLKFIGRSGAASDLVGEKLHEQHVRQSVTQGCRALGHEPSFALVVPLTEPSPGYRVHLVCEHSTDLTADQRALESALAKEIECRLCTNSQYQYALGLGQLRRLEVWLLLTTPEEAWSLYESECRHRGQKIGDIKPTTLVREANCDHLFRALRSQNSLALNRERQVGCTNPLIPGR